MASLYSIKPNPFISLISVISPVPWVLKWFSTSALVATVHGVQSANSEEVSECRPSSPGSSSEVMDQCQGGCVQENAGLRATGQSQTETRRRCAEMGGEGIARREASHIHVHDFLGMQRQRVLSCAMVANAGEVEERKPYRKSS
jgi:hypothetical protein